ncbi:hypothetical protein GII30_21360 [Gordonia amarae]|uniref:Uncharacterized protein n=1 Tax=Gordonia amarae TaxID=36821 RepID=A0A857L4I2_9ACTN|nr:hypothetical protein GII35_21655 [Gordonia amarae]QHN24553.1 hypothetical protein GII34_21155 [Gordonia amarae]QHN33480.1 hypothetical protein GII32_21485 [Gordonia amarae]QHN42201.1 hypothetical protein GII30_21360 [Gordonia amarae]
MDDHNFVALQLHGPKNWAYGPISSDPQSPTNELILNPGDYLVAPANTPHAVSGVGELSLHLTIAFDFVSGETRPWGSSIEDCDRLNHYESTRIGSHWPDAFDESESPNSSGRYRFSPRQRPAINCNDKYCVVEAHVGVYRIDRRAHQFLEALQRGRRISLDEALEICAELPNAQVHSLIRGLCRAGVLFKGI